MINRKILAELSTIFPEEYPSELSNYLDGSGKQNILMIIAFFNAKLKYDESALTIEALLSIWFESSNYDFANDVYQRFVALGQHFNQMPSLVNLPSNLYIFEYAIKHIKEEKTLSFSEIHRNFLKAYLLTNDIISNKQKKCVTSTAHLKDFEKLRGLQLTNLFAYHDIVNIDYYDILVCQFIKANYLIDFIKGLQYKNNLYKAFLSYFDISDEKDFLDKILPLVFANISEDIKHKKRSYIDINVDLNEKFEKTAAFIEKFALTNFEEYNDLIDYCSLRDKPLYKLKDGNYRIIFELFVIEKLFKSLYFHLKNINNLFLKEQKIADFRQFYTTDFSEGYLLKRVLNDAFPYLNLLDGNEFKNHFKITNAEADYFLIDDDSLFLIESKDNLINAKKSKVTTTMKL